jgi:hypothetical protein
LKDYNLYFIVFEITIFGNQEVDSAIKEASMNYRPSMARSARRLALASLLIAASGVPAISQQTSPLAGGPAAAGLRHADGSRLQAQYETVNQQLDLPPGRTSMRAAAAGLAAAARVQANLPDGFALLSAPTSHIGGTARQAGLAPAPGAADATEKYITVFPLAYQGIPLSKGSDYLTVVNGEGRLLVTRKRGLPTKVNATQPSNAARDAVAAARQAAGPQFAGIDAERVRAELQIWVDEQQNGNLAWTFVLAAPSLTEPAARRYWVSAVGEPRVLNWENEIFHTHSGAVSGNIWATTPLQSTASRPIQQLEVTRSTDMATQITGADGRYGYTTASGSADIRARLLGPAFVVQNQSGPTMESARTGPSMPPLDINFGASGDDQLAQMTAFYWANAARNVGREILAPAELAALPVRTNIAASCNAFWDGSSINFFSAGGGCPNTAYSDVVLHEYGHGVDAVKGGIVDGGYSEGFGDALAILGTRQSCLGRDFFGAGTCLRPATDVILWPPAPSEGVHAQGRRYAGFAWELVQQLKQSYSEDDAFEIARRLVVAATAANPSSIPDAVHLSFIADDNDGNLANGTPHFRALANAADSRKIPRPADPLVAGGAVAASAHFPWTPAKVVSANSNVAQATIHLDRPGKLHMSANTSARSASPLTFRTGLYNAPPVNVMWTNSLREVSVLVANQWSNFSTKIAMDLPAGNHTIYWKMWISSGSITLSGGTLLLEGFEPASGPAAVALAEPATTAPTTEMSTAPVPVTATDASGQPITEIK